ncbi:hypothetical protein IW261DRAFT_1152188 [Armillaria novae-zelandiae]|uniref:Uncharacterized protein n=1 Tax=Armillaria novae-zelandiae TaxID=153914 RepID=A0AA39NHH9_9AGAR|nr:hypothetical protein IW261DRAFT_1152188 [Armillaria novae-zelandiae]
MDSVPSFATAPPNVNSNHQSHRTSSITGAVIGCLASLLVISGGGTFLFICKRRRRHRNQNLKDRLSPNLKIIPELHSHSPAVTNQNGEGTTVTLASGVVPDLGDRREEIMGQNPERPLIEDEEERRNSTSSPEHVDTSEPQRPLPQDAPQASLDVVIEIVRLRTQVQQILVEREAESVHGHALEEDPPPAYGEMDRTNKRTRRRIHRLGMKRIWSGKRQVILDGL